MLLKVLHIYRGGFRVGVRGSRARTSLFCNHVFFWNHFEELQTVLTEVKVIIKAFNIRLPKYHQIIFNTQSFVVWQTVVILL